LGYEKALEILKFESGKQFDPDIVEAFLEFFEKGKLEVVTNTGFDF
jgi:HD-GYP domain-containing protein (c-di-GMP phosphodiesterase class II)